MMQKSFKDCKMVIRPEFKHVLVNNAYPQVYLRLCYNPNALGYISDNFEELKNNPYMSWIAICEQLDTNAMLLIDKFWDYLRNKKMGWSALSSNPMAIPLIEKHWDWMYANNKIVLSELFANPNAIPLLEKHWEQLVADDVIWWEELCTNPNAISLIEKHWEQLIADDVIWWEELCTNPNAISLIEKNWDLLMNKGGWTTYKALWKLCSNECAIPLLLTKWKDMTNPHIHYLYTKLEVSLIKNPGIFISEYEAISRAYFREHIAAEMMAKIFHPSNIARFTDYGFYPADDA